MIRDRINVERAKICLEAYLKPKRCDVVDNILRELRTRGLTRGEIKEARRELGLRSEKFGDLWYWYWFC